MDHGPWAFFHCSPYQKRWISLTVTWSKLHVCCSRGVVKSFFYLDLPDTSNLIPSRELTYPPKMAVWRWFSFSQGGICYCNFLEGTFLSFFFSRWKSDRNFTRKIRKIQVLSFLMFFLAEGSRKDSDEENAVKVSFLMQWVLLNSKVVQSICFQNRTMIEINHSQIWANYGKLHQSVNISSNKKNDFPNLVMANNLGGQRYPG